MFKNFNFFIICAIFTLFIPDPHPHLESAFGMRIPDADPGDQNHADSCGCGSATLIVSELLPSHSTIQIHSGNKVKK